MPCVCGCADLRICCSKKGAPLILKPGKPRNLAFARWVHQKPEARSQKAEALKPQSLEASKAFFLFLPSSFLLRLTYIVASPDLSCPHTIILCTTRSSTLFLNIPTTTPPCGYIYISTNEIYDLCNTTNLFFLSWPPFPNTSPHALLRHRAIPSSRLIFCLPKLRLRTHPTLATFLNAPPPQQAFSIHHIPYITTLTTIHCFNLFYFGTWSQRLRPKPAPFLTNRGSLTLTQR